MKRTHTLQSLRPYELALLTLLATASSGWAKVVYVYQNAPGAVHDGASWATAFITVQAAADAAAAGDEVWVAKGTYAENVTIRRAYSVYGGFAGTETDRSQQNPKANPTILAGSNVSTSGVSMIQFAVLNGFTVRDSFGITGLSEPFTIANCTIERCAMGVWVVQSGATISNCVFTRNQTGVAVSNCALTISNCTISGNQDGLEVMAGAATVSNCTVSGNCRGIFLNQIASATITNTIVAYNNIGAYRNDSGSHATFSHNDVYGNTSANYSNIGDPTGANGNISKDPKLSSPYSDVHLQPGSPCINAGDNSTVQPQWTDIDGQARIIGSAVDIGSDESDGTTWPVAPARTLYVSSAGNDASDGASWATAKKGLAAGLEIAQAGDEVWVAAGAYSVAGTVFGNVVVPAGVTLRGGFAGTETSRSERGLTVKTTVITDARMDAVVTLCQASAIDACSIRGTTSRDGVSIPGAGTVSDCSVSSCANGVSVSGTATVANCTVALNLKSGVSVSGAATVINSIVAFNLNGISLYDASAQVDLSHNDVYGNTVANYSGLADATGTNGNLRANPLFEGNTSGTWHLSAASPCIDAGDDGAVAPGAVDVDGQPRIMGANVDIGSDESTANGTGRYSVWRVSPTGNDANDGSTWANAKRSVSAGLAASVATDEVWVAKGTYAGTFTLPQGVSLYGGFAGSETTRGQRDWRANVTILDGNSANNAVVSSFAAGTVLDGFTVRNADTAVATYNTATIANCTISGQAYGVYTSSYPASITNSTINSANIGIYSTMGSTTIAGCAIAGNGSYGVEIDHAVASVANCSITGNGKGVYLNEGIATITACAVTENSTEGLNLLGAATVKDCVIARNGTRGVYVDGGNTVTIANCTIAGNTTIGVSIVRGSAPTTNSIVAFNGTGFFRFDPSGSEALSHNDVYGNSSGNYVTVPDPAGANGNISVDPSFAGRFTGDYHLLPGSPCIDTGDDSAVTPGETDLDGSVRIKGAHVDMGAYEVATTLPYTAADAAQALRIAAGLEAAPSDISRWNVEPASAGIALGDAIRLARKVGGLEPNP